MAAKTLMVQGTASSVGKSVLVTALCRIFRQMGVRVAPFKAQNMALNAAITPEGGEIGRAQAVQAEAAGLAPSVDMNPILLKPETEARSQVIVRGRLYKSLSFAEYHREKPQLLHTVLESLERLRSAYDLVVLEGAGSPAEINLKQDEIVNMRIARAVDAPVLLVGDIDRGGVFASFVGTMELLEEAERRLIRGFVINKFRGEASLLSPGICHLEERTGLPVLGVIPYFRDIWIPAEDSVSLEERSSSRPDPVLVDVVIVHSPRIANFDDFEPLTREEGVAVRYVRSPEEWGTPDLVILPGSKSTVADLHYLEQTGLAGLIRRRGEEGGAIIGICGGYQMLGEEILDPDGIESAETRVKGLGLLPVTTLFSKEKSTHQVKAVVTSPPWFLEGIRGAPIRGYEIHMGRSWGEDLTSPFLVVERSGEKVRSEDGAVHAKGHVLGTYLHGLFHNPLLRSSLLVNLADWKGLPSTPQWGALPPMELHYDRLADLVRSHLDMEAVAAIAGLGS